MLLVFVGVCLALLMLEVGFRIIYPDPSPKLVNAGLRTDDRWRVSFVPDAEGWNTSLRGEYSVYVKINAHGLRDVDYGYEKTPGVKRILVLGDSMTAAIQVPLEDTFVKIVESRLNRGHPQARVEVINVGIIGYGTANELLFFVDEGYIYQPDVVLLVFFTGNDVMDNFKQPFFKLENGGLMRVATRQAYSPDILLAPWERPGGTMRQVRNFLYTHSRLYSVSIELLMYAAIRQWPMLAGWLVQAGMVEVTQPVANLGNLYAYLNPPDEAWAITRALIGELKRRVEAHDARLVVAILPDESEVDDNRWQAIVTSSPELAERQAQMGETASRRMTRLLTELGIESIQLTAAMRDRATHSAQRLYYQYDGHLTAAGHQVVGQVIFDHMAQ